MRGYSFPLHRGSGDIVATPQSFNLWRASLSSHLRYLAGALRVVPLTRCAVVRERGLSSGRVGLASSGWRTLVSYVDGVVECASLWISPLHGG